MKPGLSQERRPAQAWTFMRGGLVTRTSNFAHRKKPFLANVRLRWLRVVVVCSISALAMDANGQSLSSDCTFLDQTTPTVHGALKRVGKSEVPLSIPKAYLASGGRQGASLGQDGGVLIYLAMDNWQPYPQKEMLPFLTRPVPAKLGILIVDRYDVPVAAKNALWVYGHLSRDQSPPIATSDYGLSAYKPPGDQTQDFFFHEENGKLTDFIMCNRGSKTAGIRSPQCGHYGSLPNGLQFELDYSRQELPIWHRIRANATQFLNCVSK